MRKHDYIATLPAGFLRRPTALRERYSRFGGRDAGSFPAGTVIKIYAECEGVEFTLTPTAQQLMRDNIRVESHPEPIK